MAPAFVIENSSVVQCDASKIVATPRLAREIESIGHYPVQVLHNGEAKLISSVSPRYRWHGIIVRNLWIASAPALALQMSSGDPRAFIDLRWNEMGPVKLGCLNGTGYLRSIVFEHEGCEDGLTSVSANLSIGGIVPWRS